MAELKNKKPVKYIAVLLIVGLVFTPGCWDRRELEDQAFVEAIGIDLAKNQQFAVTFTIAIPSKTGLGLAGGGGAAGPGSAAEKASLQTTVIAPSVPAAMALTSAYVNRELNLVHTKVFIFGESFARKGVSRALNFLARYREMRRNIFVCVAKGEAQKLMSANTPDLEKSYAKYWEGVRLLRSRLALHPGTLFHDFMSSQETTYKAGTMTYFAKNNKSQGQDLNKLDVPPSFKEGDLSIKAGEIPRLAGDPLEYLGTAVFKQDKFITTLDYMETQAFLILNGTYKMGIHTIKDPKDSKNYISPEIKQAAPPQIRVDTTGDTVKISEIVSLEGDLASVQSTQDYATNFANQHLLESVLEKHLKEHSLKMLKKMQKSETDIVGFGEYAQRGFLTYQQWKAFNWSKKFKDAEFDLTFDFKLRRTGLQGKQPGPI